MKYLNILIRFTCTIKDLKFKQIIYLVIRKSQSSNLVNFFRRNYFQLSILISKNYRRRIPQSQNQFKCLNQQSIFNEENFKLLNKNKIFKDKNILIFGREGAGIDFKISDSCKILILNGEPIDEPIVAHGPFVMNTKEEIHAAFSDYQNGKMGSL